MDSKEITITRIDLTFGNWFMLVLHFTFAAALVAAMASAVIYLPVIFMFFGKH